jgi:hypothetical protein
VVVEAVCVFVCSGVGLTVLPEQEGGWAGVGGVRLLEEMKVRLALAHVCMQGQYISVTLMACLHVGMLPQSYPPRAPTALSSMSPQWCMLTLLQRPRLADTLLMQHTRLAPTNPSTG